MAGLAARRLYGFENKHDEEKHPHDKAEAASFDTLLRKMNLGDPPTFEDYEDSGDEEVFQDLPEEHRQRSIKPKPARLSSTRSHTSQFISPSSESHVLAIIKQLI